MNAMNLDQFESVKKYLDSINARARSQFTAVVEEKVGEYFLEKAVIKFDKKGFKSAPLGYGPDVDVIAEIAEEFARVDWPELVNIDPKASDLPKLVKDAKDVFWFADERGGYIMAQVKIVKEKGERSYVPVTLWSDGEYRFQEPDGSLPLYGLEDLKEHSVVFLHEGAKAAKFAKRIANGEFPDHPWATELANAGHLGWIAGALSPHRTDWKPLRKCSRVYIMADNDVPGISAIPKIAQCLNCPTFSIQFNQNFPAAFDIADVFPEEMFETIGSAKYYVGPAFKDLLHPSTYMTNLMTVLDAKGKEKEVPVLREHAKHLFQYVESADSWICTEFPDIRLKSDILDKVLAPFSHSKKTSELLFAAYTGRVPKLTYDPTTTKRLITSHGKTAINLYIQPSVKPQKGDVKPFLEYIEYMFCDEKDRHEVLRWIATLVGKPETRLLYALLLISETQGKGKSIIAERILSPLVGEWNTSYPSEEIVSEKYTSWLAEKRLVVIQEIYSGHSWKMYHKVKSYITDKRIENREMYEKTASFDNWAAFFANSNSFMALKIDTKDRRWLIPKVSEEKWPTEKFDAFIAWLNSGGLSIIMHWAMFEWKDYVRPGEPAPMTSVKAEMTENSKSDGQQRAEDIAYAISQLKEPACIGMRQLKDWVSAAVNGTVYDADLRAGVAAKGLITSGSKYRFVFDSKIQQIAVNKAFFDQCPDFSRAGELAKASHIKPIDFRNIIDRVENVE